MAVMVKMCHFENEHLCFAAACLGTRNALAELQQPYFTGRTLSVDNYAALLTSLPFQSMKGYIKQEEGTQEATERRAPTLSGGGQEIIQVLILTFIFT